jgi:hypothetical protein
VLTLHRGDQGAAVESGGQQWKCSRWDGNWPNKRAFSLVTPRHDRLVMMMMTISTILKELVSCAHGRTNLPSNAQAEHYFADFRGLWLSESEPMLFALTVARDRIQLGLTKDRGDSALLRQWLSTSRPFLLSVDSRLCS